MFRRTITTVTAIALAISISFSATATQIDYSDQTKVREETKSDFHRLIAGFKDFRSEYFSGEQNLYDQLQHGQSPEILVIGCSDSRADPVQLVQAHPGELFVVRNVANIVPHVDQASSTNSVMAAVEYAVKHLKVKHIIVLGHSNCGGISALMHPESVAQDRFVSDWVKIAGHAIESVKTDLSEDVDPVYLRRRSEEANVLQSTENLLTYDWIASRCESGKIKLHSWYFDLGHGDLLTYDAASESFKSLHNFESTPF